MGSPTAHDNTFGEGLQKFGTKVASDLENLRYLSDADDQVVAALSEANSTIIQAYMRGQFNGAQAQGNGVQAQPPQSAQSSSFPAPPSMMGGGSMGTTQGYGDGLSRSMSRMQ